jgi:16S rRNA (uracil1498-N3)-methyltransferase
MREPRIHVDTALSSGAELALPAAAAAHVQRVLRLRAGAMLILFDGRGGEFRSELVSSERAQTLVRIGERLAVERESPLHITLLQGVSRGERMDHIVQKATELGVARIVPVLTEFSVVRLDADQAARRREHWQAIVVAACEQCGRNRVPVVDSPMKLTAALAALPAGTLRLTLEPGAATSLGGTPRGESMVLLIGPEGGLSPVEIRQAAESGFVGRSLGPRILRTETAPLVALSVLQALAGDLA